MQMHEIAAQMALRSDEMRDRLLELAQVNRGTAMGTLLRRFWHPIAVSDELKAGSAKPVRVMGEDLTLYRGDSGTPHLVAQRCAHRRTLLHTGWVEEDNIRCMYHGWVYNGDGQCVEMPAEDPSFPPKVRITAYPVHEYAGLLFAYLGEAPTPEFDLPRKMEVEVPGVLVARKQTWPCHWLQQVENSMDAAHVSFVHRTGRIGAFGEAVTQLVPQLEYIETEAGLRQIATRAADNVRISDWTFPNNNHITVPSLPSLPWVHVFVWMVPVDEGHTMRLDLRYGRLEGEDAKKLSDHLEARADYDASDHHDALFKGRDFPEDGVVELTSAQDYVAQIGQGALVDRTMERLGKSDLGVITLRKIFWRELDAMKEGRPMKEWRRRTEPLELPIQGAGAAGGRS